MSTVYPKDDTDLNALAIAEPSIPWMKMVGTHFSLTRCFLPLHMDRKVLRGVLSSLSQDEALLFVIDGKLQKSFFQWMASNPLGDLVGSMFDDYLFLTSHRLILVGRNGFSEKWTTIPRRDIQSATFERSFMSKSATIAVFYGGKKITILSKALCAEHFVNKITSS